MMQYYHIEIRTIPYWHDDLKVKVKSLRELKDYVKQHIADCLRDYPLTTEIKQDKGIKKIYKRLKINDMFIDKKDGSSRKIGKVYSIEYLPTEQKQQELKDYGNQSYVSYWCHKLRQKDLLYSGQLEFSEVSA